MMDRNGQQLPNQNRFSSPENEICALCGVSITRCDRANHMTDHFAWW